MEKLWMILTIFLLCVFWVHCKSNNEQHTQDELDAWIRETIESEESEDLLPDLEPLNIHETWPTSAYFSTNPQEWPGHRKPIASESPSTLIDKYKTFPSRKIFIEDYFTPSIPLQILDPLKDTNMANKWPLSSFYMDSGFAAVTWINATLGSHKEKDGYTKEMSLAQYFKQKQFDQLSKFEVTLPDFMRLEFPVPVSLQCRPLLAEMLTMKLRSFPRWTGEDRVITGGEGVDRLTCTISGTKTVLLANTEQMQRDSNFTETAGDYSSVDFTSVDFTKFPLLRFAKFIKVDTKPSDCLYVPAKWTQFQTTSAGYLETELSWGRVKIESTSDKICGEIPKTNMALGLLKLKNDPDFDIHRVMAVAPLQTLFEAVSGRRNFTFEQMQSWLKNGKTLLKKVVEWNEEYDEIAGELFLLLDLNRDSVFSANDLLDGLTREKEKMFLGQLQDRIQDFTDIMNDQQSEKTSSGSAAAAGGMNAETKAYLDKYNDEVKKLIAETMEKIKELNETQSADSGKKDSGKEQERKKKEPKKSTIDRDADTAQLDSDKEAFSRLDDKSDEAEEIMAEEEVDSSSGTKRPSSSTPAKQKEEL